MKGMGNGIGVSSGGMSGMKVVVIGRGSEGSGE